MATHYMIIVLSILTIFSLHAHASDPDPLQDFCVAVNDSTAGAFVNGKFCKDPDTVTAEDFFFSGLNKPGNTSNQLGSHATQVFVRANPGENTLGVSVARLDFALKGLNPPHHHPRATEMIVVVKGHLYTGFITSNPVDPNARSKVFAKVLGPGDVFLYPKGLIHWQYNVGETEAVAFVSFNSQNPGVVTETRALFGSYPPIYPEVLAKNFQVDEGLIEHLQSLPWTGNN